MSYHPSQFTALADKEALVAQFVGKHVTDLPTPSFVIDKQTVKRNIREMSEVVDKLGCTFRPHVKTHKTTEGTKIELTGCKTKRILVSTLAEAWNLLPLCESGDIEDILYSMPLVKSKLGELDELSQHVQNMRFMLDDPQQLDELVSYSKEHGTTKKWSVFIKMNMGTNRAGFVPESLDLITVLNQILDGDAAEYVELFGFYCHGGHSYSCKSKEEALKVLEEEISSAEDAAKKAVDIKSGLELVLSVGATPTVHVAGLYDSDSEEEETGAKQTSKYGELELHAGNFAFCDLQQVGTNCCTMRHVAARVVAEVVSSYPGRGEGVGEQLVNAGVLALGREPGQIPGYGAITSPLGYDNWIVGRVSQEHGILTLEDPTEPTEMIPYGTKVLIAPQHMCIAASMYPWYAIVDGTDEIVDVWVPWRSW